MDCVLKLAIKVILKSMSLNRPQISRTRKLLPESNKQSKLQ